MRKDDIVGFWVVDDIVCLHCITEKEKRKAAKSKEDVVHYQDVKRGDFSFCDRCKRPLIRDS